MVSLERELFKDLGPLRALRQQAGRQQLGLARPHGQYEDVTITDDTGADATGSRSSSSACSATPPTASSSCRTADYMKTDTHAVHRPGHEAHVRRAGSSSPPTPTSTRRACFPRPRRASTDRQSATARFSDFGQNPNDFVNAGGKLLGRPAPHLQGPARRRAAPRVPGGRELPVPERPAWARRTRVAEPDLGFPTAPEINLEERDGSRQGARTRAILDMRLQKSFSLGKKCQVPALRRRPQPVQRRNQPGRAEPLRGLGRPSRVPSDFLLPAPPHAGGEVHVLAARSPGPSYALPDRSEQSLRRASRSVEPARAKQACVRLGRSKPEPADQGAALLFFGFAEGHRQGRADLLRAQLALGEGAGRAPAPRGSGGATCASCAPPSAGLRGDGCPRGPSGGRRSAWSG